MVTRLLSVRQELSELQKYQISRSIVKSLILTSNGKQAQA